MKIAVLGVGTAGITSLCHLLGWLPSTVEITSIYDPNIKILGIGESSTPDIEYLFLPEFNKLITVKNRLPIKE